MKILELIKKKKGFTLIEMVIALAVLGVFSLCVATITFPVLNTYFETQKLADSNMVCSSVMDSIRNNVSIATTKPVITEGNGDLGFNCKYGETHYFTADETGGGLVRGRGVLYRTDVKDSITEPVFDASFYKRKTITVRFDPVEGNENAFSITVSVYDGDEVICTQTSTITPIALK